MTKQMLIGIHAKPRSGKDTVANYLIKQYKLYKYGSSFPVKDTAAYMFKVPRQYFDDDNKKDTIDPFWGITYREMAQKVGKEGSRDLFGEDFWLRHVEKQLKRIEIEELFILRTEKYTIPYEGMILADIRYENEVHWVKQNGGKVIFIKRSNLPASSNNSHPAEAGLSDHLADVFIHNDGTLEDLYKEVDFAMERIKEQP